MGKSKPLAISYDVPRGIVTVDGVSFAEEFFRTFGTADSQRRYLYEITQVDGAFTIWRHEKRDFMRLKGC